MALTLDGTNGIVSSGSITTQSATGVIFSDSSNQGAAASPFGLKNRIINGDMVISQRGTSFTGLNTDGSYTLDRWFYAMNGGGAVSSSQSSTAPAGFINSILTTVTTADSTVSSGSYYQVRQAIEGLNVADLGWGTANAQTVTVSFWVRSSVTGTYSISLRSNGGASSYVTTYSISSANTWTYIKLTIPGPTSGTWLTTNGIGIFVTFDFGSGSSSITSSTNTWISSNATGASGATRLINTNGATFFLTGVQLERNTTATPFEWIPYTTELQLCQRYYWQLGGAFNNGSSSFYHYAIGYQLSTTQGLFINQYPVTMRASPSFTVVNPTNFYVNTNIAVSAIVADQSAVQTFSYVTTNSAVGSNFSGTRLYGINATTNAIQFNAEL